MSAVIPAPQTERPAPFCEQHPAGTPEMCTDCRDARVSASVGLDREVGIDPQNQAHVPALSEREPHVHRLLLRTLQVVRNHLAPHRIRALVREREGRTVVVQSRRHAPSVSIRGHHAIGVLTLMALAVITGASAPVHNGLTLLALLFLAAALAVGLAGARADQRAEDAAALAEGVAR